MQENPRPDLDADKPNPDRRTFLRNTIRLGAAAAIAPQILEGAVVSELVTTDRARLKNRFEVYPSVKMPEPIGGQFTFIGASHWLENAKQHFDEHVKAVRSCDGVLLEYPVLPASDYFKDLIALDDATFKKRVLSGADELAKAITGSSEELTWFKFISVLAAREGKPVIGTDPGSGFIDAQRLEQLDQKAVYAEYSTLIAAAAGVLSSEFSKKPNRREVLLKFLAAPALLAHGAVKAIGSDPISKVAEMFYLPKEIQQMPFGKVVTEISTQNLRDFGSVAGLYSLANIAPQYFKDKKISGFYGGAHFPVMQILQLPKGLVDAKIAFYKKIDPTIITPRASINVYDPDAESPISEKPGGWKTIAEVRY